MREALKKDISRYASLQEGFFVTALKAFHNPGLLFSILYRFERSLLYERGYIAKLLGKALYPLYFWSTYYLLTYHIEPSVTIGPGLFLHNQNIVITDNTVIGNNFTCMGMVTIGTDFVHQNPKITIGNNVKIGTGAKIIAKKDLHIADSVTIGANAVVTKSILIPNSTWAGIPARQIIKKKGR